LTQNSVGKNPKREEEERGLRPFTSASLYEEERKTDGTLKAIFRGKKTPGREEEEVRMPGVSMRSNIPQGGFIARREIKRKKKIFDHGGRGRLDRKRGGEKKKLVH